MAQGRPKTIRVDGTGEKLYMALKLSGLSWGAHIGPNHIAGNGRWLECGLPRSVNTVIEDIRSGIPVNRLGSYAAFFHVPPRLFVDTGIRACDAAFSCEILKNKGRVANSVSMDESLQDSRILRCIVEQNSVAENYPLFQLLFGVYRIYYRRLGTDTVFQGAARTERQTNTGILTAGTLVVAGIPVEISGTIFRWNKSIHLQYLSDDYQVLGTMMAPDPTQSVLLRRRDPFCLKFQGLAGSLEATPEPDRFEVCAVKQPVPEGRGLTEFYEELRDRALDNGAIEPGDAAFATVTALFDASAG